VDSVLRAELPLLRALYDLFCAKDHSRFLRLEGWLDVLDTYKAIGDHTGMSKREAKLIFAWWVRASD
jgi:hypothetical protein